MEDPHKTIQNNIKDVLETIFSTPISNLKDLYNRIYNLVDEIGVSGNTYHKLRIQYKNIEETDLRICIKNTYHKPYIHIKFGSGQTRFPITNNPVCSTELNRLCTIWENTSGYVSFRICESLEDSSILKFIMSSVWNSYVLRMQKIAGAMNNIALTQSLCEICVKRGTEIVSKIFGYYLRDIEISNNLLGWEFESLSKASVGLSISVAQGDFIYNKFVLSNNISVKSISDLLSSMDKQISDVVNSKFENAEVITDTTNHESENTETFDSTCNTGEQEFKLKEVIPNILYKNTTSINGIPTFNLDVLRLACSDIIYAILEYDPNYIFKIDVRNTDTKDPTSRDLNLSIFNNIGCVFHDTYSVRLNKQYPDSGSFVIKGNMSNIRSKNKEEIVLGRLKLDTDLLKIIKNSFYYNSKLDRSKVFLYQCVEALKQFDVYKRILSWRFGKHSYYALSVFTDSPNKLSISVEQYNHGEFANAELITLSAKYL